MIGAIIGDMAGSHYELSKRGFVQDKQFPMFQPGKSRFTDDTVLTCATAQALLNNVIYPPNFSLYYKSWGIKYPNRGYGSSFKKWLANSGAYAINNSYGNGCMMRCGPIGMYYKEIDSALAASLESIEYTHNSPESARGVQSIVSAINMSLNGHTKEQIKAFVEEQFGHMLDTTVEEFRNKEQPSIRCNITAPRALVCFMESTDYESAIRNAVYTKGDTDTVAAIAGSIAEAYYGPKTIPKLFVTRMKRRLPKEIIHLINNFYSKVGTKHSKFSGFQI